MRAKALGLFVLLCGHLVGLSVGNKAGSSENTTLLQNAGVLRTGEQQLFGRAEPGPGNEADSVGLISPAQVEDQVAPFVKEFRRVIKKNEICWKATFSQRARAILEASPWVINTCWRVLTLITEIALQIKAPSMPGGEEVHKGEAAPARSG